MNKEAFVTQLSFHFSPASGHILPLQTIRERIRGIWESLTWPIVKRILKADLAVTILFALLLVEPIRERAEYGIILAQVAAEFIHPAKSYGALGEVYSVGSIVVVGRFVWSIITDVLMPHVQTFTLVFLLPPKRTFRILHLARSCAVLPLVGHYSAFTVHPLYECLIVLI